MATKKSQPDPAQGDGLVIQTKQAVLSLRSSIEIGLDVLASSYGGLVIQGTGDKEGLKKAEEGIRTIKDIRVKIEKRRKELIEPALEYQRQINSEAKEITARLEQLELPLRASVKEIEAKKADEKAAKAAADAVRFNGRTQRLFDIGVVYNGNIYQLGTAIATPDGIRDASDEAFEDIFNTFSMEVERLAQVKADEEARRKEEDARRKEEEERLAQIRREQEEKLEAQRKEAEELQRKADEARAQIEAAQLKVRAAQLIGMGAETYYQDGKKAGLEFRVGTLTISVSAQMMRTMEDDNWDTLIAQIESDIAKLKEQQAANEAAAEAAAKSRTEPVTPVEEVAPAVPVAQQMRNQVAPPFVSLLGGEFPNNQVNNQSTTYEVVAVFPPVTDEHRAGALGVVRMMREAFKTANSRQAFSDAIDAIEAQVKGGVR